MTTQDAKTTYLLTSLSIIETELKKENVFNTIGSTIQFMQSHADEVGQKIADLLKAKYHNLKIVLTPEWGFYSLDIRNVSELLKNLQSELAIDWSKKTYSTKKSNSWEWAMTSLYTKTSPPKEWYLNSKNHNTIAEAFDSAEEIKEDPQYIAAFENLQTAKKALQLVQDGTAVYNSLSHATKTVDLWQEHADAWEAIYKIGLKTDYEQVKIERVERKRQIEAENNEAIKELFSKYQYELRNLGLYCGMDALELFEMFNLSPVCDLELVKILHVSREINTLTDYEGKRHYKTFEDYLIKQQIKWKDRNSAFKEKYYKVNGEVKKLSYKQLVNHNAERKSIEGLDSFINFLMKHEKQIKSFVK